MTLYQTSKKINFSGRTMKMDDLTAVMEEIVPLDTYNDKIRFSMSDGAVWYVYPVIQVGKTAIRGAPVCTMNLEPFRDIERRMVNKDCVITMTWPPGAIEAEFKISNSEIKGPDDPNLERRTVRRKDYEEDRQVVIPMGESVRKYIRICAKYRVEDEIMPSRPVVVSIYSVECRKVRYKASRDKRTMTFSLSADPEVKEIPAIMAVQSSERIPLRSGDGEVVWRSEGPVPFIGGTATASIGPLMAVRRESTMGHGRREARILEAVEMIRREACDGLTAEALAARFPGSRRLFELRFREAMGRSVLDEILHVRMQKIQTLLADTDIPIGAIADFCGFGTDRALRKIFLAREGVSMAEWRRLHHR